MRPLEGTPVIRHVLERVGRIAGVDEVVLATSDAAQDDELAAYVARTAGVRVFRGPEHDVLARFAGAASLCRADTVARFTADCPLLCPSVSARVVDLFHAREGSCDYSSNTITRTYPRGLDTEVFSAEALFQADREALEAYDREHVTPFLWRQPARFRLCQVTDETDRSASRWTLDTERDYDLIARLYLDLYPVNPLFDYPEIVSCLERHPDWNAISQDMVQNGGGP
jgi:spore coat polysaccharide biosynthesis protein SpsF